MGKIYAIGASHGDEEIVFHLRSISVAEENRFTSRYSEINDLDSDEKRAEQEYEIQTEAIANWSEKNPTVKRGGKELQASDEGSLAGSDSPAAAVAAYFAERTNEKERTAQQVLLQYRRRLQPKVVFY
jgi:hypothetical protein